MSGPQPQIISAKLAQCYVLNNINDLNCLYRQSSGSYSKAYNILKLSCQRYNYDLTLSEFDEWCGNANGGLEVEWERE